MAAAQLRQFLTCSYQLPRATSPFSRRGYRMHTSQRHRLPGESRGPEGLRRWTSGRSSARKAKTYRVNRCFAVPVHWIPACAGMTGEMCAYASPSRGRSGGGWGRKLAGADTSAFETSAFKAANSGGGRRYGVVTLHRPSNVDSAAMMGRIGGALTEIAAELPLIGASAHARQPGEVRHRSGPGLFACSQKAFARHCRGGGNPPA